jgi:hypothetical protein
MERGLVMMTHSAALGALAYLVMTSVFNQPQRVAENKSLLLFAALLIYMILFGHNLPFKINEDLF